MKVKDESWKVGLKLIIQKTKNMASGPIVQFSHSVMFDSLQTHELQHARLLCPSPSPWVCSNSYSLSWWCHPTISCSVIPFSSCLQSFPASGSFPMSWLFASGGQSIGASASVLLMNIQGWFPLGLAGLISLLSKGLSRIFSSTTVQKRILSVANHVIWNRASFISSRSIHMPFLFFLPYCDWTRCSTLWKQKSSSGGKLSV